MEDSKINQNFKINISDAILSDDIYNKNKKNKTISKELNTSDIFETDLSDLINMLSNLREQGYIELDYIINNYYGVRTLEISAITVVEETREEVKDRLQKQHDYEERVRVSEIKKYLELKRKYEGMDYK